MAMAATPDSCSLSTCSLTNICGISRTADTWMAFYACTVAFQHTESGCRAPSDLILDEGEEGADNQGQPILDQGRHLVAEALASTRWHEAKHISALQGGIDDFSLHWPVEPASASVYNPRLNYDIY